MDLIKRKGIEVEIKWTPGQAEIEGNEEADRLAKEASKEAELMSDEGTCISQPELKQAAKTHGLTVWQRQWDISDKGTFLHQLKPKVTTKILFDFPKGGGGGGGVVGSSPTSGGTFSPWFLYNGVRIVGWRVHAME